MMHLKRLDDRIDGRLRATRRDQELGMAIEEQCHLVVTRRLPSDPGKWWGGSQAIDLVRRRSRLLHLRGLRRQLSNDAEHDLARPSCSQPINFN